MNLEGKIPFSMSMITLFNDMICRGRTARLKEMLNYYEVQGYEVKDFVEKLKRYDTKGD